MFLNTPAESPQIFIFLICDRETDILLHETFDVYVDQQAMECIIYIIMKK